MTWPFTLEGVLVAAASSLVSLAVAYVVVAKDLAFIKGQLSQVMLMLKAVDELKAKVVTFDESLRETRKDVSAAHEKIRILQKTR